MKNIDKFNGLEEEFKKWIEKLEEPFNHEILYRDQDKKLKEYEGEMKNNKDDGRGISYKYNHSKDEEDKSIENNEYSKDVKYEGYGKEYYYKNLYLKYK